MWTEYIVKPFSGKYTGKHRRKQAAYDDAQSRTLHGFNNPSHTVYKAVHHTDTGMLDLIPLTTYWYDKELDKLQWDKD